MKLHQTLQTELPNPTHQLLPLLTHHSQLVLESQRKTTVTTTAPHPSPKKVTISQIQLYQSRKFTQKFDTLLQMHQKL